MMTFNEARKYFAEQVVKTGGATLRAVRNEKGIQGFELPPDTGYMVSYKLTEERDFLVIDLVSGFKWHFQELTRTWAENLFEVLWHHADYRLLDVMLAQDFIDGYYNMFSDNEAESRKIAMDVEYIGAWIDGEKLIGDYSKHFDTLDDAIAFGKANEQAAIYDLANKTSIYL